MKEFIELHALEFGSDQTATTPMMIRISEIMQIQPMTGRIRKQMMAQQREGPITEPPINCCGVMTSRVAPGQPQWAISYWVEESYEEIKVMLGLNERPS